CRPSGPPFLVERAVVRSSASRRRFSWTTFRSAVLSEASGLDWLRGSRRARAIREVAHAVVDGEVERSVEAARAKRRNGVGPPAGDRRRGVRHLDHVAEAGAGLDDPDRLAAKEGHSGRPAPLVVALVEFVRERADGARQLALPS